MTAAENRSATGTPLADTKNTAASQSSARTVKKGDCAEETQALTLYYSTNISTVCGKDQRECYIVTQKYNRSISKEAKAKA